MAGRGRIGEFRYVMARQGVERQAWCVKVSHGWDGMVRQAWLGWARLCAVWSVMVWSGRRGWDRRVKAGCGEVRFGRQGRVM